MTLGREHLPFPCSLRDRVTQTFPQQEQPAGTAALAADTLIERLGAGCAADETPIMAIRRQTEAAGERVALAAADAAALEWVTLAFDQWERDYPLEGPLRDTLRQLLPLAAALALREERFFTPGAHPLHTLLDQLQHSAVGWQLRLERAGQMLEQRIQRAVERALRWFEEGTTDFAAITKELIAAAHRDEERAARMIQRLEETETAAAQTRRARREAARLINEGLAACELPSAIGEFLKGPWYDSLQLVAIRYGTSSQEWREVTRITQQLMASVQPLASGEQPNAAAQRRLSGELRHWLLSLQHDAGAADDAIGLVEYVHLRRSHGQDLGLTLIPPVKTHGDDGADYADAASLPPVALGDWFLTTDEEGPLRAQLSLMLEDGAHLLFTNAVGLKALDAPREDFIEQLRTRRVTRLYSEDTFSLSLAHAAGIDSEEALRALVEPAPPPSRSPAPASEAPPSPAAAAGSDAGREPSPRGATTPSLELELAHAEEPRAAAGRGGGQRPPPGAEPPTGAHRETTAAPRDASPERPRRVPPGREMDVPMGAWLGFHDGETPIMAKVAVYNPRTDQYIFVNRRGIALRELGREELLALIDDGLVDILETRSYFRDEVQRARLERDE